MGEDKTPVSFSHTSVLLQECLDGLAIKPDGIYVDGTCGGAGHSSEIAKRLTTGRLIGIDQDMTAVGVATERLAPYGERAMVVHSNFCELDAVCRELGISHIDGFLADLGVSSYQLDTPERGFSYMADAPLDMRMNSRQQNDEESNSVSDHSLTAYDVVNTYSESELRRVLYE